MPSSPNPPQDNDEAAKANLKEEEKMEEPSIDAAVVEAPVAADVKKETEDPSDDDAPGTSIVAETSITAENKDNAEEILSKSLPSSNAEAFWKEAWPVLEDNGWSKSKDLDGNPVLLPPIVEGESPVDFAIATKGKDYFVRIIDVILRMQTRSTPAEATAADKYRRAVSKAVAATNVFEPADFTDPSPRRKRAKRNARMIDESWKDAGRRRFPKKRSAIGEDYQVLDIPEAAPLMDTDEPESLTFAELIWDSQQARAKGITESNDPITQLSNPHLREAALIALAQCDYDSNSFLEESKQKELKPFDGSDWTTEQRDAFHTAMFRLRRDLPAVAKTLSLPLTICHAYYLGTYKYLDAYRVLKAICIDERYQQEGDANSGDDPVVDACEICGDGGNLIICDACELEYHIDCVKPPLKEVPEGRWECDACVDRGLLRVRDANVKKYTELFEPVVGKKETTYKPTAWALEIAESFVVGIQEALHGHEGSDKTKQGSDSGSGDDDDSEKPAAENSEKKIKAESVGSRDDDASGKGTAMETD